MDGEAVKKVLHSVLQSSQDGVPLGRLQADYRALCGEQIPVLRLGHPDLEDFLRSVPSVVRMEPRGGEMWCFAMACRETRHIAGMVARQKSERRSTLKVMPRARLRQPSLGGSSGGPAARPRPSSGHGGLNALGGCRKVVQLNGDQKPAAGSCTDRSPQKPSPSQPEVYNPELVQSRLSDLLSKHSSGLWLSKLPGVYLEMFNQTIPPQGLHQLDTWTHICSVEELKSTNRTDRLLYPPLPLKPTAGRPSLNPPDPASPEPASPYTLPLPKPASPSMLPSPKPASPSTNYNSLPSPKPSSLFTSVPSPRPASPSNVFTMSKQQSVLGPAPVSPGSPLAPPTFLFPLPSAESSPVKAPASLASVSLRSPSQTPGSAPSTNTAVSSASGSSHTTPPPIPTRSHGFLPSGGEAMPAATCPSRNTHYGHRSNPPPHESPPPHRGDATLPPSPPRLRSPVPLARGTSPTSPSHPAGSPVAALSPEVPARLREPLCRDGPGPCTHPPPELCLDTSEVAFPDDVLSQLHNVCSGVYPVTRKCSKAVLCEQRKAESQGAGPCSIPPPASGIPVLGLQVPPPLALPVEQYPSVLVADAQGSTLVTVRYIGENYSKAQESMENAMLAFYTQSPTPETLPSPAIGQLVAVIGEARDQLARAQVMEVMTSDKVKVYYVDDGFSMEVSSCSLLKLHQDFLTLPFQAISVQLAGLEACSSRPVLLSMLHHLAVGRVLLMETVEEGRPGETPALVVLYDTSQDEDLHINEACLQALQDHALQNLDLQDPDLRDPDLRDHAPLAALRWIRQIVPNTPCSMKVEEVPQSSDGAMVKVPLFSGSEDQKEQSLKQQLVCSGLLRQKQEEQNNSLLALDTGDLSSLIEKLSLNGSSVSPMLSQAQPEAGYSPFKPAPVKLSPVGQKHLLMPPLVELPQVGQNMDVYVPVASHPGHFVVQPWQDLSKLVVLMGEMVLYYNQNQASSAPPLLHKENVYAAQVDNRWHRVLLKGVLSTGLVSVYELDYGHYQLVSSGQLRTLIPEFRWLPFQAVSARLAGVPRGGWSEEASMVFRTHVEKRALVAQVESVHEGSEAGSGEGGVSERRLTVFLVDTSNDHDVWIHNIMTDLLVERPATSTT